MYMHILQNSCILAMLEITIHLRQNDNKTFGITPIWLRIIEREACELHRH